MEELNFSFIKELDSRYGTPFYILDSEQYKRNIHSFKEAFCSRYDKILLGHSFKTNYVPALCKIAKQEGLMAEVVSEMEYDLARIIGFDSIIFNGPVKRISTLTKALDNKAIINLDSEYEVEFICRYKQDHPLEDVGVGLRININLSRESEKIKTHTFQKPSRFGFSDDGIIKCIEYLRHSNIKIVSLHGHTSTIDRETINFKMITRQMLDVCERFQLNDIKYFDVGGGFFGAAPEGMDTTGKPRYKDYANVILDETLSSEWFMKIQPWIVIEPGVSVISNVFTYYTKVYQNKHIGDTNYVTVDGTIFDVKPSKHCITLPHKIFRKKETELAYDCDVVGSTCMEKDILLENVHLPALDSGDYIQLKGVGAYTISMTPSFVNFLAPILVYQNSEFIEVRRRQNLDDIIKLYTL